MFGVTLAEKPTVSDWDDLDPLTNIGVAGLTSIDRHNRSAEFSLYIAPEHQKKAYGAKALELLLYHGFEDMGLNRIWGEVFAGNPAMHMFQKLGFKAEGCLRDTYWKHGEFIDSHMISMLAREFRV
jgi:RimJ/RimL family protein N-acetyltransferase